MARMARRVALIALALGAGGAEVMEAQARGSGGAAVAFVGLGLSHIATGELDERLAAGGYPTFGRTATAVGVGAYLVLEGGAMLGGEWTGLIMGDGTHDGRAVGLGGGYGTLGAGYAVSLSPRVRVFPRLGLGGGGMGLWIQSAAEAVDFDEVLANPDLHSQPTDSIREIVLSRGSAVVDVGAGAELLPGGWGRGLMIGVRLGYLAAPSSSGWGLNERDARGGPAAALSGPYLRVVVGGGPRW